ncbi:MAG TPA: T9SS type A sorting domain-containing protein [Chitinophagaceae bacterium]|nr:T9SS type A sorting domain-containing protein [Chitinophagaceae bacterium]
MKKLLILVTLITFSNNLFSQASDTLECDAPDMDSTEAEALPWFGNNDYLEHFLDSIGYNPGGNRIVGPDRVRYHVPIKFWVYRSSAGTGGPNLQQLQNYIDNLNNFYNVVNDTKIGIYMKCEIGFIDDDDHLEVGGLEAWGLIIAHKESGCINVHITNSLRDAFGVSYRARFFGVDGIFLSQETYTRPDLATTLSHEVGHYFELVHTHHYANKGKCRKEAIDRNRTWPFIMFCPFGGGGPSSQKVCEATGDFLRDTPADHDLSPNNSCIYYQTQQVDPWGDHYESPPTGSSPPDTRNILSYNGLRSCRVVFSRLQIAVMLHSIERGKSQSNRNAWKDLRAEYDEYEMDNFSEVARNITLTEVQERNFNQQYEETVPVWSQCDVDWVRFVAPCSSNFEVFTAAMPYRTNANTKLTLFDNNLVQLAQNDDISATNQFSSIQFNFIAGIEYFIRVENMNNLITGYYTLQIGQFSFNIVGPQIICNISDYSISNLPAGATVTWSIPASAGSVLQLSPNTPLPNQLRITNMQWYTVTTTLTAVITNLGCGIPDQTRTLTIANDNSNAYYPYYQEACTFYNVYHPTQSGTAYSNQTPTFVHQGCMVYVNLGIVSGTVSLDPGSGQPLFWAVGPTSYYSNTLYFQLPLGSGGVPFVFNITGNGACFNRSLLFFSYSNNTRPSSEYLFTAVPNPAKDVITIQASKNDNSLIPKKHSPEIAVRINVYDINTNTLQLTRQAITNNLRYQLNVSALRTGYYVIQISEGDQSTALKFFKE